MREKLLAVMEELKEIIAEREELIELIAVALLTGKNLFILGDTGQAKSYVINEFRKRIDGARQYERILSKQTEEDALFGRIDLKSYIEGNPKIITKGKIPESHIIFLDEIFKSNEGVLNTLLTVLNERRYTNEDITYDIPAISFFSASNEIPDFKDPENELLRPLFDRYELKVLTHYIQDADKRKNLLENSINNQSKHYVTNSFSIDELYIMKKQVEQVSISSTIIDAVDEVLCELRRQGIHVSDRKFLNCIPVIKAKAWLDGREKAELSDLLVLVNYFWNKPEEISVIEAVLTKYCINPIKNQLEEIYLTAEELINEVKSDYGVMKDEGALDIRQKARLFRKFREELLKLYVAVVELSDKTDIASDRAECERTVSSLEDMSKEIHGIMQFTHVPLQELQYA